MQVQAYNQGQTMMITLNGSPDICPFCHKSIHPKTIYGYFCDDVFSVFMLCPNHECHETFIAKYHRTPHVNHTADYQEETTQGNIVGKTFSDEIEAISPSFVVIYNQAYAAEQMDLMEICGVGYRKALEFLIKDYAILKSPDKKERIEKILLGKVIEEFATDSKIKSVAKRASWLGNDETHYVKRWEGKSIEDLKKLIALTLHWIEAEVLTESIEQDMPD